MSLSDYWKSFLYDFEHGVYEGKKVLVITRNKTEPPNTQDNNEAADVLVCIDYLSTLSLYHEKHQFVTDLCNRVNDGGKLIIHLSGQDIYFYKRMCALLGNSGFSDISLAKYKDGDRKDILITGHKRKKQLVFAISHHSGTEFHTQLLRRCIRSIKTYTHATQIIVSKTSTSVIPDDLLHDDMVVFENVGKDGTAAYGAMEKLVGKEFDDDTNFVIFQDSMYLVNYLPAHIWSKSLFSFWTFKPDRDHANVITTYLNESMRNRYTSNQWMGVFGPAFGGKISTLKLMWEKLSHIISQYDSFPVRENIMASERIMGVTAHELGIHFETTEGSIHDYSNGRTYYFRPSITMEEADEKMKNDITGHVRKVWVGRK